jgi:hypothetical protein
LYSSASKIIAPFGASAYWHFLFINILAERRKGGFCYNQIMQYICGFLTEFRHFHMDNSIGLARIRATPTITAGWHTANLRNFFERTILNEE